MVAVLCCSCVPDLGPGAPPRGHVIWRLPIPGWSVTPALGDQSVYFASRAHDVVAVDRATGRERWRRNTGIRSDYPYGANLVFAGDVVVMPDILLFAFDTATGTLRWTFRPANRDQPGLSGIATDGETIYTPSIDNHAYAVDARTGQQKWDTTLPGDSTSGSFNPAVRDGLVFIGVKRFRNPTTGAFVALDAATGAIRWTHEFQPGYPGALTGCLGRSAFDGPNVIVAAEDGQIYAFDRQTGAVRWTAPRVHSIPSEDPGGAYGEDRPVAVTNGIVVAGSNSGILVGLDAATGAERWRRAGVYAIRDRFTSDGEFAYITMTSSELISIDAATGTLRWQRGAGPVNGDGMFAGAAIADDVRLYVSGYAALYAVRKE